VVAAPVGKLVREKISLDAMMNGQAVFKVILYLRTN
jgi:hypothetical protein